jgi:alpha-mannosidase
MDRLRNQVEFARKLADLHPNQAGKWRKLIEAALAGVDAALVLTTPAVLHKAVREAESLLEPIAKVSKTYMLHCVGHAHIDMNWMWSWPETVAVVNDSLTTVLKLMDEFPTFKFSQSQASVYRIVQEHNPEMFARIQQRVKEGPHSSRTQQNHR